MCFAGFSLVPCLLLKVDRPSRQKGLVAFKILNAFKVEGVRRTLSGQVDESLVPSLSPFTHKPTYTVLPI